MERPAAAVWLLAVLAGCGCDSTGPGARGYGAGDADMGAHDAPADVPRTDGTIDANRTLGCPTEGVCIARTCPDDDGECPDWSCPTLPTLCEVDVQVDAMLTPIAADEADVACAFDALLDGTPGVVRVRVPCTPGAGTCEHDALLVGGGIALVRTAMPGHPAGATLATRGPAPLRATDELEACRAAGELATRIACLRDPIAAGTCRER